MQNRNIFQLTKKLCEPLIVTERTKALYHQGELGQGFVGFVDVETGKIEVVPAWNKDDGKIRKPIQFQDKYYGVESVEPLGSSSGDVHIKGLAQLGLSHRGGVNGCILGFGFFKTPNEFKFRNKSSSQNLFSVEYNDLLVALSQNPLALKRSLPAEISYKIINAMQRQLPISMPITLRKCDNFAIENEFAKYNKSDIEYALASAIITLTKTDKADLQNKCLGEKSDQLLKIIGQINQSYECCLALVIEYGLLKSNDLLLLFLEFYLTYFDALPLAHALNQLQCLPGAGDVAQAVLDLLIDCLQKKAMWLLVLEAATSKELKHTMKFILQYAPLETQGLEEKSLMLSRQFQLMQSSTTLKQHSIFPATTPYQAPDEDQDDAAMKWRNHFKPWD